MVTFRARPPLSLPMLISLDLFLIILNVIYALYAMWTCISVYVCVNLYRMCFLLLALSPAPWLACCPCDVTARSAPEWESHCATRLRILIYVVQLFVFFPLVCQLASCCLFLQTCPLWFNFFFFTLVKNLSPLVFSGCVIKTLGMFFYAKATSIVIQQFFNTNPVFCWAPSRAFKVLPSFLFGSVYLLEPPPPPTQDSAVFVFVAAPHCPIFDRILKKEN